MQTINGWFWGTPIVNPRDDLSTRCPSPRGMPGASDFKAGLRNCLVRCAMVETWRSLKPILRDGHPSIFIGTYILQIDINPLSSGFFSSHSGPWHIHIRTRILIHRVYVLHMHRHRHLYLYLCLCLYLYLYHMLYTNYPQPMIALDSHGGWLSAILRRRTWYTCHVRARCAKRCASGIEPGQGSNFLAKISRENCHFWMVILDS